MSRQDSAEARQKRAREILQNPQAAGLEEIYRLSDELKADQDFRLAPKLKEVGDVRRARSILRGEAASDEQKIDLAQALTDRNQFGLARKLLGRINLNAISDPRRRVKVGQRRALCTYKDPDTPADERLASAFEILKSVDDPATSNDQETLGLAGAIYKRIWESDAQKRHLERALAYYTRGYGAKTAASPDYDFGYTGINAAFVQDLLAHEEETEAAQAGAQSESAKTRRAEAKKIREDLVATLPDLARQQGREWLAGEWWFYATIAEAYFGLGRYSEALPWLKDAAKLQGVPEWQLASTTRQLAFLAQMQVKPSGPQSGPGPKPGPGPKSDPAPDSTAAPAADQDAYDVLGEFLNALGLKSAAAAIKSAFSGKIGLGLSGGGFRASLFHIGVLARLAELDLLRRVEVISCVSGGSIIGAHYQLEVRNLLAERPDEGITQQDYIDLVARIERDFLAGVQRNIRTRVAAGWLTNVKMVLFPNYSRTKRAGELYETELYGRVTDGGEKKARFMSDLLIRPADGPEDFKPSRDNWRRVAKVPDLILNATSLNTGHNWQFTATWMGEPPAGISSEIDGNYRLRRLYYQDAPADYKEGNGVRLGDAVGASACVPALFEPLTLAKLYGERGGEPKEIREVVVRLVDGGVHDNQGITSLLEQGCSQIIVSDASGQMDALDDPGSGLLGVPLRSNSILMARVREAQYQELSARRRSSLLQGLLFVHLKKDLAVDPLDWRECNDTWNASDAARPAERAGDLTSYGVKKDVQRLLSAVRTDLDSFSEAEAYALMMSGYAMIERAPAQSLQSFPSSPVKEWDFRFKALREPMRGGPGYDRLVRLLKVSHMRGFKIWKLHPWRCLLAALPLIAAVAVLVWLCWRLWSEPPFQRALGAVLTLLAAVAVGTILYGVFVRYVLRWRKTLSEFGIGAAMATLGFIVSGIHLLIFDRIFLNYGRAERVTGRAPGAANAPST